MIRTRVDGNKFQDEVERGLANKLQPLNLLVRLHTTKVRSVSDFIIFSKSVSILEVKETGKNSFSTRTMQQRELVEEFQDFYRRAVPILGNLPYRIYILVHFISKNEYVVMDITENLGIVRSGKNSDTTFDTLEAALTYILGRLEWK